MNTANVDVLLTITAQPGLEETLVDWLLTKKSGQGFSSFPIDGHSNHHEGLTLSEQGPWPKTEYTVPDPAQCRRTTFYSSKPGK